MLLIVLPSSAGAADVPTPAADDEGPQPRIGKAFRGRDAVGRESIQ
jgi:hypothetical protein